MCTLWSRHACSPHNQTLNQSWSPQPCNGDNSNIDNGNNNDNPRHQYNGDDGDGDLGEESLLDKVKGASWVSLGIGIGQRMWYKERGLLCVNGLWLSILIIVVCFFSYNLILLVVYLASGPSVQSRYAKNLIGRFERNTTTKTKRSMCHLFCDNSWILWGACQVVDGGYTNLRMKY